MPELPEVETIRRDLVEVLVNQKVKEVIVQKGKMIRGATVVFKKKLVGKIVKNINRRGKLLIFGFKGDSFFMLIHLKMTGQLIYEDRKKVIKGGHENKLKNRLSSQTLGLPNKYSHIVIKFQNKSLLFFNDMRQFGYAQLVARKELDKILLKYGYEPLTAEFTRDYLKQKLSKRNTALKNVLLDQTKIAGLGNIYVDETCFSAKIKPTRVANRITATEITKLHQAINLIIKKAIEKRGTTFDDYRDGRGKKGNYSKSLKVYGRAGLNCLRCKKGIIKKTKINGRGTVFCSTCQK